MKGFNQLLQANQSVINSFNAKKVKYRYNSSVTLIQFTLTVLHINDCISLTIYLGTIIKLTQPSTGNIYRYFNTRLQHNKIIRNMISRNAPLQHLAGTESHDGLYEPILPMTSHLSV